MRAMSTSAFITCALTGAGDSTGASDKVPVTPEQIADSAIEAAQAAARTFLDARSHWSTVTA